MIISKTPLRVSFVGGGSDLEEFYKKERGSVISTSIDKYIYLSMHKLFDSSKSFLKYSQSEQVECIGDIKHNIIREVFKKYKIHGVDFNSSADIPSGTGLGSSSAFTCGLINLCLQYLNLKKSKYEIAEEACDIEIKKLKEPIGKQDQYACCVGGLNQIYFNKNGNVEIIPLNIDLNYLQILQDNLYLFYTGETRSASKILSVQKRNTLENDKFKILKKMVFLTEDLKNILLNQELSSFGDILHQAWCYKKELAKGISNSNIDELYNYGISAGATGGKLLGAGGGGFVLFYCNLEKRTKFLQKMSKFREVPFSFENNGSSLIKI